MVHHWGPLVVLEHACARASRLASGSELQERFTPRFESQDPESEGSLCLSIRLRPTYLTDLIRVLGIPRAHNMHTS